MQIVGYAENENQFEGWCVYAKERFEQLHKLYDIYNSYPDVNNIKSINDNAGISPVEVSQEIIDLLTFGKNLYFTTSKTVNIALGAVLSIWHKYRTEGLRDPPSASLPPFKMLLDASKKTDINKLIINISDNTAFISEPGMSIDVGAIAKGYATEIVASELIKMGMTSGIISTGGNVRIIGSPEDGRRYKFGVGIQNPNKNPLISSSPPLDTLYAADTSVVTSGDYQRYYMVDGVYYHHLIDPETLMPANHFRAVVIKTQHSGFADFLSSAIFILSYEEGKELIESIEGAEALWIFSDGQLEATEGMKSSLNKMGGAKPD